MKYLVFAYRYGTMEYTYPVGIFETRELAIEAAQHHREYRGGKYDHKVFPLEPGILYDAEESKGVWVTGEKKEQ